MGQGRAKNTDTEAVVTLRVPISQPCQFKSDVWKNGCGELTTQIRLAKIYFYYSMHLSLNQEHSANVERKPPDIYKHQGTRGTLKPPGWLLDNQRACKERDSGYLTSVLAGCVSINPERLRLPALELISQVC